MASWIEKSESELASILRRKLRRQGYFIVRHRNSETPDIVAIGRGRVLFIEVKATSKGWIYVKKSQASVLRRCVELGSVYIAVRMPGRKWRFIPFEKVVNSGTERKSGYSYFVRDSDGYAISTFVRYVREGRI